MGGPIIDRGCWVIGPGCLAPGVWPRMLAPHDDVPIRNRMEKATIRNIVVIKQISNLTGYRFYDNYVTRENRQRKRRNNFHDYRDQTTFSVVVGSRQRGSLLMTASDLN